VNTNVNTIIKTMNTNVNTIIKTIEYKRYKMRVMITWYDASAMPMSGHANG
jgi:hypothetical protein